MTDDTIREAVARALCSSLGECGCAAPDACPCWRSMMDDTDAALSALPLNAATLADLAAGRAVVVPRVATDAMFDAGHVEYAHDAGIVAIYRTMLAASPYAARPARDASDA